MTAPVDVTPDHLQRAYAQLRKPSWPSLEALREAYVHYATVRARAVALATGAVLPPIPMGASPPTGALTPVPPPPARRRTDSTPFSTRAAQAGEYVHPDE